MNSCLTRKAHEEVEELKRSFRKSKKIERMHSLYGFHPPDKCADCIHLAVNRHSKNCYKCELYGITAGASTDWRISYGACGKFVTSEK